MKIKKNFVVLFLFMAVFCLNAGEPDKTFLTQINQPVPPFSVKLTDGKEVNINSLKGKVVLINFFADWCPPCKKEMPHLEKDVWQKFKKKDFVLIAIGREHNLKVVAKFKKDFKLSFWFGEDPKRKIYAKFATQFIPRNYIINKKGIIVFQEKGFNKETTTTIIKIIKDNLK